MNKLIILINQAGTYKGGAQKRYIELFKYLNKDNKDYYLLMNDSLYHNCIKDGIVESSDNLLHLPVLFESKIELNSNPTEIKEHSKNCRIRKPNYVRKYLGKLKYFIKCLLSSIFFGIRFMKLDTKYKFNNIYTIFHGGVWTWPWLILMRKKYLYSYNDTNFSHLSANLLNLFSSEYWVIKHAYQVDCLSPYIKEGLLHRILNKPNHEYIVTPNSFIDYNLFHSSEIKENLIVFCSRLEILKNPYLLVESIEMIKNKMNGFKVVIIGDGNEYNRIAEFIKDKDLNDIIELTGALGSSICYIRKSKIFVSLQQNNNYPSQSLLEAMACKNAIIASDVGETRMLVTEDEGVLVSLNKEKLANAILYLIDRPLLCSELGKNAYDKATSNHSIELFADYFNNIMSYD